MYPEGIVMNVVLIISDSLRPEYLGCYGNNWIGTPHIDGLARQSVMFDNFYTASFPTGPMRRDLHSGRFTFTYNGWTSPWPTGGEDLLAPALKAAGFRTSLIGDMGHTPRYGDGFDHVELVPTPGSPLDEGGKPRRMPASTRKLRTPVARLKQLLQVEATWRGEEDRRCARTMRSAHRWLEENAFGGHPFFLMVDTFDPHEPWNPPKYYIDRYDPGYEGDELFEPAYEPADYASQREIEHMRRMYAGAVSEVDRWIGYLLEGISRMGLADDTAVILTSDHGFYHGEHGLIGKVQLSRKGVIVRRWALYKTIAWAPLLVRVPGVSGGKTRPCFCQPPDLAPTILELAGATVPGRMEGESILPVIRGKKRRIRDFAITSLTYVQDAEARCPTSFRTRDHLYIYGGDEWTSELYDLSADPDEKKNIIKRERSTAEALHRRYMHFLESINCPTEVLDHRRAFDPTRRKKLPHQRLL